MYWTSWDAADFSTSGRLDTGHKFLKSSGFRLHFFNSGVTDQGRLSETGREAYSKEQLSISVINGSRIGKELVRTEAGSGSGAQVLTLGDLIKLVI